MGTPETFKKDCDKFISIENLIAEEKEEEKQSIENRHSEESKKVAPIDKDEKPPIDKATLNLIYKAVKDNSDDNGWANLGMVGLYISAVKPDFDTRNYGFSKLSGLVQSLELFETKIEGSQMFLRKGSFSTFIKLVQKAIKENAQDDNWANIRDVIEVLKKSELNISNYNDAIESIHNGWIELSKDKKFIKVNKIMP